MNKKELQTRRQRTVAYLQNWKAAGKKTAYYTCQHCGLANETPVIAASGTGAKKYTDSAKLCLHCGLINFVKDWPNAKTEVIILDNPILDAQKGRVT